MVNISESVWRWVTEVDNWLGIALCTSFALALGYIYYLKQPRTVERAMARRVEKQRMADIALAAFDDAVKAGRISVELRNKALRELSRIFPDLIPQKKSKLIRFPDNGKWRSFPSAHPKAVKAAVMSRLSAMGVNIAYGLSKIRESKAEQKQKLLATLKKKA